MTKEFYTDNSMKLKQLFVLIFTSLITLVSLFLSFINNEPQYWLLSLVIIIGAIFTNYVISRISDLRITKTLIIVENLYIRKGVFKSGEYNGVEAALFSPPYYKLILKCGRKHIFYDASIRSFSSVIRGLKYAKEISEQIQRIIN